MARREAAGFSSQTELAQAMGVDRARVSDWETGKVEPKGKNRSKLLHLLNATEEEIFGVETSRATRPDRVRALEKVPDTIEFLSKFSKLSPARRDLVLAVTFDDSSIIDGVDVSDWPQWLSERLSRQAT